MILAVSTGVAGLQNCSASVVMKSWCLQLLPADLRGEVYNLETPESLDKIPESYPSQATGSLTGLYSHFTSASSSSWTMQSKNTFDKSICTEKSLFTDPFHKVSRRIT